MPYLFAQHTENNTLKNEGNCGELSEMWYSLKFVDDLVSVKEWSSITPAQAQRSVKI